MKRIQILYIIVSAALILGFSTAGYTGFRLFSLFAVTSWVHTGTPGVHHK
jgi:hypothetical protein